MSKSFFLLVLFFFILILPQISSAEISLLKNSDSFDKGETLVAIVSGNFLEPPATENIIFYRGHVKIPMDYNLVKFEDDFYIYASLLGKNQGNYSLSVENVKYNLGIETSEENLVQNFTITESTAEFSINKGFIFTDQENFEIELQNLKSNKIEIQIGTSQGIETENSLTSLELKSGEIKQIGFLLNSPEENENIVLSSGNTSYSIPVLNFSGISKTNNEGSFDFEPRTVKVSLATDSEARRIVYLLNTGDVKIKDVNFFVSPLLEPYAEIIPESSDLGENSTIKLEILITSDSEEKILEGQIIARTFNLSRSLTLILDFIPDFIPPEGEEPGKEVIITTCGQLNGNICIEGQECNIETIYAKDGVCCTGQCIEIKKSSKGKYLGWGMILVILAGLYWFYQKKYKRVR